MTRILTAALLLAGVGVGSQLNLDVAVRGDTFVPYEPIYVRIEFSNLGTTAMDLPDVNNSSVHYVANVSVVAPGGETLRLRPRLADVAWPTKPLPPGTSVSAAVDITEYANTPDPASKGTVCMQPGGYTAAACRGDVVSNAVRFVVREPTDDERRALGLYRDLVYYSRIAYWSRPGGPKLETPVARAKDRSRRVEELATRIVRLLPQTPYTILAERELAWEYHSRVSGSAAHLLGSSPQAGAWRDSTRAIYGRVLSAHPDSPIAEHMLSSEQLPEVFGDSSFARALLDALSTEHPGTLAGREAASQLRALSKQTGEGR